MALANPFVWGRGGAALTPAEIAKRRQIEDAILAQGVDTSPVGHWAQGLARVANAAGGAYRRHQLDGAEAESQAIGSAAFNKLVGALQGQSGAASSIPMTGGAAEVSATAPTIGQPIDMTGNEVYNDFMGTVKSGIDLGDGTKLAVTNPYALAAVASTAKAESGFDPGNVNRTWSDPSESGQAGTAGGLMSWRGPRYDALAATGDLSPAGQARFFLQEDPTLIEKLNGAKSVEEAQSLMNNAWRFAGYNRPGGEAANRLAAAHSFLPTFQGQGEVASLDPSIGMADGAIVPGAEPIVGGALADEVAEYEGSPEYAARFGNTTGQPLPDNEFDKRFGETPLPVEQFQGQDAIAQALIEQQQGASAGQQAIAGQTGGIPATGQAAQADGIMQAVTGGNAGGAFGLNPMQEQATRQYAQANLLQDPAFLEAMSSPYMTDQQRAIAQTMVEQRMKADQMTRQQRAERDNWMYQQQYEEQRQGRDPLRQAQIKALQDKGQNLINAGDGRLYDPQTKEWILAPNGSEGKGFRFGGNSVEAQSLNGLMDSGQLTADQAQQLGAGKTITGPNGEIIFMTPQGVFGSSADGQTQKLSSDVPAADAGVVEKGARQGNITLTEPKVTIDERRAMGFADRMDASGKLLNKFEQAGLGVKDQFVRGNDWIPDFAENWLVGDDFQQFDQARRDFINSQLRRESGAVISPEEFDNANKQYFPQPGDTKEVVEQKRANRDVVIKSMARDAGPTYGGEKADPLADARKAIAAGANRDAVAKRLRDNGIDPGDL